MQFLNELTALQLPDPVEHSEPWLELLANEKAWKELVEALHYFTSIADQNVD